MVQIANITEIGTAYTNREVEAAATICKRLNLILLMYGARLSAAMASPNKYVTLNDFWIRGTQASGLIGEAVVIEDQHLGAEFSLPFETERSAPSHRTDLTDPIHRALS